MYSGEKYNMMFKEGYKHRTWFFSQTEEGTTIDIDLIIPLVLLIHAASNNLKELLTKKLFESVLLLWVIVKTVIEEDPENLLRYENKDILLKNPLRSVVIYQSNNMVFLLFKKIPGSWKLSH